MRNLLKNRSIVAFIAGMGTVLNLGGGYLNSKESGWKKDRNALTNDWKNVGKDLQFAIGYKVSSTGKKLKNE